MRKRAGEGMTGELGKALKYPMVGGAWMRCLLPGGLLSLAWIPGINRALPVIGGAAPFSLGVFIWQVAAVLATIFIAGYWMRIVRNTLAGIDEAPPWAPLPDVVSDGIAALIVLICYSVLPWLCMATGAAMLSRGAVFALAGHCLLPLGFLLGLIADLLIPAAFVRLADDGRVPAAINIPLVWQHIAGSLRDYVTLYAVWLGVTFVWWLLSFQISPWAWGRIISAVSAFYIMTVFLRAFSTLFTTEEPEPAQSLGSQYDTAYRP